MGESKRKKDREAAVAKKKCAYSDYLDRRMSGTELQEERKKQLTRISKIRGRAVLVFAADFTKGGKAPISISYEDILPF